MCPVSLVLVGLGPASQVQADLFGGQDRMRAKQLMAALDSINERFGSGTLQYASSGIAKKWKATFHRRSPAFTTSWDELPVVH